MTSAFDMWTLHDGRSGSSQRLLELVGQGVIEAAQLIPISEFAAKREADIEDLFDRNFYLTLLRESGTASLMVKDLTSKHARITRAVEDTLGDGYSHYQPARHLLSHRDLLDKLTPDAMANFDSVFQRINGLVRD